MTHHDPGPDPGSPAQPAPATTPAPELRIRIGTAEREAVVERLHAAVGEGRLDVVEFDERVAQVYVARTVGDLVPITADLPPAARSAPASRAGPVPGPRVPAPQSTARVPDARRREGNWLFWAWRAWATAVTINLVIWLAVSLSSGDLVYFWPMWVAGPWGAVLLVNTAFGGTGRPRRR